MILTSQILRQTGNKHIGTHEFHIFSPEEYEWQKILHHLGRVKR